MANPRMRLKLTFSNPPGWLALALKLSPNCTTFVSYPSPAQLENLAIVQAFLIAWGIGVEVTPS